MCYVGLLTARRLSQFQVRFVIVLCRIPLCEGKCIPQKAMHPKLSHFPVAHFLLSRVCGKLRGHMQMKKEDHYFGDSAVFPNKLLGLWLANLALSTPLLCYTQQHRGSRGYKSVNGLPSYTQVNRSGFLQSFNMPPPGTLHV